MLKPFFDWMSPGGARANLSVLIFHRVLPDPDPLFPDEMHARAFDSICSWLKSWLNVIPLNQAMAQLNTGTLPARAACLTFDDGYADNHDVALPILQRHGLSATFFIATGFLDGGRMWNDTIIESIRRSTLASLDLSDIGMGHYRIDSVADRRNAIIQLISQIKYLAVAERLEICRNFPALSRAQMPEDLMMTSGQIKVMYAAGMGIGAHTVSHPILARLDEEQAHREIKEGKDYLEKLLDARVGLFAYPNGKPIEDYSLQSVALVRQLGFDAAVSTAWGASRMGDDLFQIRRFTPWDKSKTRFGARLLANLLKA